MCYHPLVTPVTISLSHYFLSVFCLTENIWSVHIFVVSSQLVAVIEAGQQHLTCGNNIVVPVIQLIQLIVNNCSVWS